MGLTKVRREGAMALLGVPAWVARTVMTETSLRLLWRWRQVRYRLAGWRAVPAPTTTIDIDPA